MSSRALAMLESAIATGAFPAAAAAAGNADGVLFRAEIPSSSVYDLASLTKVMATTMVALRLADEGVIDLFATIGRYVAVPAEKSKITLIDLLRHTGGFEAHYLLSEITAAPARVMDTILRKRLSYEPGSRVVYSCIGFILLGKILELVTGEGLDVLSDRLVFRPLGMQTTGYGHGVVPGAAPTERDPESGTFIRGVVHDENARFLCGVSGNAGLFSNSDDCAVFARCLLTGCEGFLSEGLYDMMVRNWTSGMSSARGLGVSLWDGNPEWPGGTLLGPGAYGHTGFTGTSIFVSPSRGLFFVLLTNRVHYGRDLAVLPDYRALYHAAVIDDIGEGKR